MQLPVIHLNGSDPVSLLAQYMTALEKAQEALQALRAIDVNGRDYYIIANSNAASDAYREHRARCAALETIISDLSKIAEHIDEQPATVRQKRYSS